jgi:hypothetical protein
MNIDITLECISMHLDNITKFTFAQCSKKCLSAVKFVISTRDRQEIILLITRDLAQICINGHLDLAKYFHTIEPIDFANIRTYSTTLFVEVCRNDWLEFAQWIYSIQKDQFTSKYFYKYCVDANMENAKPKKPYTWLRATFPDEYFNFEYPPLTYFS